MKAFKSVVTRRRNAEEIPTARVAIRNFCLECVGYQQSEIEKCTDLGCWIFPWRFGKTPPELVSDAKKLSGKRLAEAKRAPTTPA